MDWINGMNRMLAYIEEHLTDPELSVATATRHAAYSPFYLQRIFYGLTDLPLAEYIRNRRMSQAGEELKARGAKVIDIAFKYGYGTPESFQKAFRRFHGVSPSAARRGETRLMFMAPLQINVSLKGGSMMDYQVENKHEMTVMGFERRFENDTAFTEIPKFWNELLGGEMGKKVTPLLGCCFDEIGKTDFAYLIGNFCDKDAFVPDGMVKRTVPAYTWVMFHTDGKTGPDIQTLNRQIFSDWLPSNTQYEIAAPVNIEVYPCDEMDWQDKRWGIWIPVRPAEKD